jgi:hypothetical protein
MSILTRFGSMASQVPAPGHQRRFSLLPPEPITKPRCSVRKRRIPVLIAYLTADEVNQDLASRMADDCGVALILLSPRDRLPDGAFDAAIFDLDYLPAALRDEILANLLSQPTMFQVAVHTYNLLEGQIESLSQKGVSVYRRLERAVFLNLLVAWRLSSFARPPMTPVVSSEVENPFIRVISSLRAFVSTGDDGTPLFSRIQ